MLNFSRQNASLSRRMCEGGYTYNFRRALALSTRHFRKTPSQAKKSLVYGLTPLLRRRASDFVWNISKAQSLNWNSSKLLPPLPHIHVQFHCNVNLAGFLKMSPKLGQNFNTETWLGWCQILQGACRHR